MKRDLTRIFLEAAEAIDGRAGSSRDFSCHAVARADGVDPFATSGWERSRVARFYFYSAHGGESWNLDLWRLPREEIQAVRVLLLCFMAAAWRDLPRKEYGL